MSIAQRNDAGHFLRTRGVDHGVGWVRRVMQFVRAVLPALRLALCKVIGKFFGQCVQQGWRWRAP